MANKVKVLVTNIQSFINLLKSYEDEKNLPYAEALKSEYEFEYLKDYVEFLEHIAEITDGDYRIWNHGTEIELLGRGW